MSGRTISIAEGVRRIIGDRLWLGVSTHNPEQISEATKEPANYLAVGPVFATSTKADPDPVIGLEGVRQAKLLTDKPLVAIGGSLARIAAQCSKRGLTPLQ